MVALKALFFTLASVIAVNADWHISFTYADGGQIESHGFVNSGCVNFSKTNSAIVTVFFDNNINTDTLELVAQWIGLGRNVRTRAKDRKGISVVGTTLRYVLIYLKIEKDYLGISNEDNK